MDTFFVEETKDGIYRIAVVDRHRIFSATNPGKLATTFECSAENPSRDDDAEIFYALAPAIGADDPLTDLINKHRSHKLNYWSICVKDVNTSNIFLSLDALDYDKRIELYDKRQSITCDKFLTANSKSLFVLLDFSKQQNWKTGILQECIDRLVKIEFRRNAHVYALIDEVFRQIIRFKIETEDFILKNEEIRSRVILIRKLLSTLGLKHSRDTSVFTVIPETIDLIVVRLIELLPTCNSQGNRIEQLSFILKKWSGSSIIKIESGLQLKLDEKVTECLSYTQEWLQQPHKLQILDTPM